MNLSKPLREVSRVLYSLFLRCRIYLPRQRCLAFVSPSDNRRGIGPIYVINLDRQPNRWKDVHQELNRILDAAHRPLSERTVRHSACDARVDAPSLLNADEVERVYTLGEQLFVEPQPHALPDAFDLERPIRMTSAEVAVARSHIGIWRRIAASDSPYALVLEDDVWFERGFGQFVDQAWNEMQAAGPAGFAFDVLYLSYKEVRHGAPKELLSKCVFRPERGLWYLSGYVLSKEGARKLLELLPCRGPVDLWINHKYGQLTVRALRRSVVHQRLDLESTNSYSVLPALTQIGVLDEGGASLFQRRPIHSPVFVFGASGSGLSSLAMALSMLGYRCCSDIDQIPTGELESLLEGRGDRTFDAYVNVGSLRAHAPLLARNYGQAKFIALGNTAHDSALSELDSADVLHLRDLTHSSWREICEHLRLAPPDAPYPSTPDLGLRTLASPSSLAATPPTRWLRHDTSPWVAERRANWPGINTSALDDPAPSASERVRFDDDLSEVRSSRWLLRNDTFPGNLGLFRPANVTLLPSGGISLSVIEEPLGVRSISAAAISSRRGFLFGRFEATLRAADISGLVTGFFLHRDSPRQEIDIEIAGNRPDHLLVNVFYNPGLEGAKFDYGYRGTPASIQLGFDASKAFHRYAIEWDPCEIRWFVDDKLVHRRVVWDPTPIPHLPMTLHVNTWPTRSRELAGRFTPRALPASTVVRRVAVDAFDVGQRPHADQGPVNALGSISVPESV